MMERLFMGIRVVPQAKIEKSLEFNWVKFKTFGVRTGRFELPTSCLSSKRSKPTELSPHSIKDCKGRNFFPYSQEGDCVFWNFFLNIAFAEVKDNRYL